MSDKVREALELGLDYAREAAASAKELYRNYPAGTSLARKWKGPADDVAAIEAGLAALAAPTEQAAQPVAARDREANWWSLVMNAAASLEDAANCLRDEDAKRAAEGAVKHYREKADAMWTTHPSPPSAEWVAEAGRVYGIIDPDYGRVYTMARKLAWEEGYAIGLHGSFTRDLDLIAVPWTEKPCEPEHLVQRILDATGLRKQHSSPSKKPQGRLVWTLLFPGFADPRFVDLSIIPTAEQAPTEQWVAEAMRLADMFAMLYDAYHTLPDEEVASVAAARAALEAHLKGQP